MSRTCDFAANWARWDAEKGPAWPAIREATPEERARIDAYNEARDNPLREPLPDGWRWIKSLRVYRWEGEDMQIDVSRSGDYFRIALNSKCGFVGGGHGDCGDKRFLKMLAKQPEFALACRARYRADHPKKGVK